MDFVQNFPCFSIILCLFAGILSSGLKDKAAMRVNTCLLGIVTLLSGATLLYTLQTGQSFVYVMGKFPAPWGNEIRAGVLEALTALFFLRDHAAVIAGWQAQTVGRSRIG